MKDQIGPNEARILASLSAGSEMSVADLAERLERECSINDGSIYVALQRMATRGFVTTRKVRAESADGRVRDIGRYTITAEGEQAADAYFRELENLLKFRLGLAGA